MLSDRSGDVGLWGQRVDTSTPIGNPIRLEPSLGVLYPMGLTAGGAYFMRRQIGTRDVYLANIDPTTGEIAGEPVKASTEKGDATGSSDWSPDGRRLVFFRRNDDRRSLVVKSLDDGREHRLEAGRTAYGLAIAPGAIALRTQPAGLGANGSCA